VRKSGFERRKIWFSQTGRTRRKVLCLTVCASIVSTRSRDHQEVDHVNIVMLVRLFVCERYGVAPTIARYRSFSGCGSMRRRSSTLHRKTVKSSHPIIQVVGRKSKRQDPSVHKLVTITVEEKMFQLRGCGSE